MNVLKTIVKGYGKFLVVYWSVAGVMALAHAGARWGESDFDNDVLKAELHKRLGY